MKRLRRPDFSEAKKYVYKCLKDTNQVLDRQLHFHNYFQIGYILNKIGILCREEKIPTKKYFLLKTAALYMYAGFPEQYGNRSIGIRLAQETLPDCGYKHKKINIISKLILSKLPSTMKKLDKILHDSETYYFGTRDFFYKSERLRREEEKHGIGMTAEEWYVERLEILEKHRFRTESARNLLQKGKEKNIRELRECLGM